jgi:hypothetical protein
MTTIAISIRNTDGYKLVTMNDGDSVVVGQTLKEYYSTPELINALLDNGNIVTLGNTIQESTFTGEPVTVLPTTDIRESEIIIKDKNFLYLEGVWMVRNFDEEGYTIV